jgi:hypothetical protein
MGTLPSVSGISDDVRNFRDVLLAMTGWYAGANHLQHAGEGVP